MRHLTCLLLTLAGAALGASLEVNGSFERSESVAAGFLADTAKARVTVSPRLPQLWQINHGMLSQRDAPSSIKLVDAPARAHGGRCALELKPGEVFLPGVPVRPGAKVTIRFFATGRASVNLGARLADGKGQMLYPPPTAAGAADAKGYTEYTETVTAPENALGLTFNLGSGDALVDDLSIDVDGLSISAPDLTRPVAGDADTLALATGDVALPANSAFTGKLVDGLFGKACELGAEEMLQVPGRYRELLGGGTIELWLRPHWEGNDGKNHPLVDLSSDGFGMTLNRDMYNHVAFYGSDGWTNSTGVVLSQHWMFASRWGADDWHHVAVSWTPTRYWLFIDGCLVDTALDTTKPASNTSFCTGRLPGKIVALANLGSSGTDLDEVRISSSVRYWAAVGDEKPPARVAVAAEPARPAETFPEPKRPDFTLPEPPKSHPQPVEFFASATDPNAADDNPGTAEKPFRTITRGVKELLAGDTLTVRGGTYRETVDIDKLGTAAKPILVRAAPGETVVIKGSDVVRGWTREGETWKLAGWTQALVEKQYARGARHYSPDAQFVFQRDGIRGDALPLYRTRTAAELREGKCYWDSATGTLTIWPVGGARFDPNQDGVEVPNRAMGLTVAGQYVTARGFQVRQCAMVTNWGSNGVRGFHCTLEDCLITWCAFGGVGVSGFYNTLRGCEASYCGNSGMGAGVGEGLLIENCTVTHNNWMRFSPGWHGGGAKLIPWFNHSIVRGSEFAFNYGPGLWFDGSCNDSLIEGNRCHDNEGPGIMVEISRNTLVRNNICYNNRGGLPGYDIMPIDKGFFPYQCEMTRVEGGPGGNGIFISSSPGTRCYNNLCYRNESAGIFAEWALRESEDVTDYAKNERRPVRMSTHDIDIRNNILVNNLSCQLSLRRNGVDEFTYNNRSDHNLLYTTNGVPLVRWGFGGLAFSTIEKWREASGFDTHGVSGGPVFEFAPGLDLRLQPDSPGVDQGELLADVPADANGVPRPQGGAADVGPYEIAGTRKLVERPAIPTCASFFSVDLSKVVNRAFADEKADDGQGGWSDQGPTTDLRTFPTGHQVFAGIPFDIPAPVGCVVLKSGMRPQSQDLPERVVIPVHRKADVLYFLHSGAWIGGGQHHWTYLIHRGDGTTETLKVVAGENLRDWSDPNAALPFDREFPTTTTVAWSGANQTFDKVSVYGMAFANHSDWCEVTEIEMVGNEGRGVPILIAITVGRVKAGD